MDKPPKEGARTGRLVSIFAISIVAALILWPGIMVAFNAVVFPGFESCKRQTSRHLSDPESSDFDWPPLHVSHQAGSDIWRYGIIVRTTNSAGGGTASLIGCTVDGAGRVTQYTLGW